jgi:hypothetical protein
MTISQLPPEEGALKVVFHLLECCEQLMSVASEADLGMLFGN